MLSIQADALLEAVEWLAAANAEVAGACLASEDVGSVAVRRLLEAQDQIAVLERREAELKVRGRWWTHERPEDLCGTGAV
jgi:hypothetical protein